MSETREYKDSSDELRNWLRVVLTIITMIVMVTIFVSSRPTRDEVDAMIDKRTSQRFDRLEKQNDTMLQDIKELLRRTPSK